MDFITLTIDLLKFLSSLVGGNFGLGIILLTIIVRLGMWSLSVSQQKSMREMQKLQPEMKRIQERYKSNPQMMQQKMMEFYKKHNFNPTGGCLPMLIQIPFLWMLYAALISPQFISLAGDSQFLFIKRLDSTIRGNIGTSNDGIFQVGKKDSFIITKSKVKVTFNDGTEDDNIKVTSKKALAVMGDITPGEDIDFKINTYDLSLKPSQIVNIKSVNVLITDASTREVEELTFTPKNEDTIVASIPTTPSKSTFNYDVLILVLLFGGTMFVTQKVMMATQKGQKLDPQQEAMQKMMSFTMPIFLTITFFYFPIPAGVLLYLVSSNIFQVAQTAIINKQLDELEAKKKATSDDDISDAKKVEAKEIKTVKEEKNDEYEK